MLVHFPWPSDRTFLSSHPQASKISRNSCSHWILSSQFSFNLRYDLGVSSASFRIMSEGKLLCFETAVDSEDHIAS